MSLGLLNAASMKGFEMGDLSGRSASSQARGRFPLALLRQQWDSLLKNLPDRILSSTEFRGFAQRFRSVLCETSPEIFCRDLIGVANSASSWEEFSGFREQVLQWALAQAPNKSLKEQASRALRKLSGNPNSLSESVQFLAHDIGRHPVRLSLLAGMGAAGLGMRMGRLAGTVWAQARGFGAAGQFVARSSVGFGTELGFFSVGTRAAHLAQGKKIDWSISSVGQEIWEAFWLLGPMKLINPLGHLGRVTGGLRLLQAGTAHFAGASVGTWASVLANKQALTSYQIFSGATHLMFEGAIASGLLSTGLPGLEAAHRALDMRTNAMLKQSLTSVMSRAKAFWERPFGDNFPMGPREALAGGMKHEALFLPKPGAPINPRELIIAKQDSRRVRSSADPRVVEIDRLLREVVDEDQHSSYPKLMRLLGEIQSEYPTAYNRAIEFLRQYEQEFGTICWREHGEPVPGTLEKLQPQSLKIALMEHRGDLEKTAKSLGLTIEAFNEAIAKYGKRDPLLRHPERSYLPLKTEADFSQFEASNWEWFFTYAEIIYGRSLTDIIIDYNVYSGGEITGLEVHSAERLPAVEKNRKIRVRKVSAELYEILLIHGSREVDFISTMARSPAAMDGHLWIPPAQFLIARRQRYEDLQPEFLRGLTAGLLDRMYEEYVSKSRVNIPPRQFSLVLKPSERNEVWQGRMRAWRQERHSEGDIVVRIERAENNETEQAANVSRYSIDSILAPETIPVAKYLAGSDAALSGVLSVSNIAAQPPVLLPGERTVLRLARQGAGRLLNGIQGFCKNHRYSNRLSMYRLINLGLFPEKILSKFDRILRALIGVSLPDDPNYGTRVLNTWNVGLEANRYSREELVSIFGDNSKLDGYLRKLWDKTNGKYPFPLDRENGVMILNLTYNNSKDHYINPVCVELRDFSGVKSFITERGNNNPPLFVFRSYISDRRGLVIGISAIRGKFTNHPALSWLGENSPGGLGKSIVVRAGLNRRWDLSTQNKLSPTVDEVGDFVRDICEKGREAFDDLREFFGMIDNQDYAERRLITIWGLPYSGNILDIEFAFDGNRPKNLPPKARRLYVLELLDNQKIRLKERIPAKGALGAGWKVLSPQS